MTLIVSVILVLQLLKVNYFTTHIFPFGISLCTVYIPIKKYGLFADCVRALHVTHEGPKVQGRICVRNLVINSNFVNFEKHAECGDTFHIIDLCRDSSNDSCWLRR